MVRRPRKRKRENAYAAIVVMLRDSTEVIEAILIEFPSHLQKGNSVEFSSSR